ncbi:MAG: DNA gyrase modulator, partial [Bacteroidales bacterium]
MRETQIMMALFGVTPDDLKKITQIALSKGGDYADLYFEYSTANELSLRDGEVNSASSHIDYGMGVRVLSGDRTGYAYTEVTTMEEMVKAAKAASAIASQKGNSNKLENINITPLSKKGRGYYPVKKSWEEVNILSKAPFLQQLN